MRAQYFAILFIVLFATGVTATHQVEYRVPSSIITTVGKLTSLQIDLINKDSSIKYYRVEISGNPANQIDISNSVITTSNVNPNSLISIYTNIRTLTEAPNVITIKIYADSDLSHAVTAAIPMSSKKFSLPEFGITGFLQIMILAALSYYILINRHPTAKL